jgi:hypothetical protein
MGSPDRSAHGGRSRTAANDSDGDQEYSDNYIAPTLGDLPRDKFHEVIVPAFAAQTA